MRHADILQLIVHKLYSLSLFGIDIRAASEVHETSVGSTVVVSDDAKHDLYRISVIPIKSDTGIIPGEKLEVIKRWSEN